MTLRYESLSRPDPTFNPLDWDALYDSKDNPTGRLLRRGKVLSYEKFDTPSLGVWRPQHSAFQTMKAPIGLTDFLAFNAKYAMMISTSESAYSATADDRAVATYAGLSQVKRPEPDAFGRFLVSFSYFYAFSGTGNTSTQTNWTYPWGLFESGFDTQYGDASARYFFKSGISNDGTSRPSLVLRQNTTATTSSPGTTTSVPVPGSEGLFPGGNEGKMVVGYKRDTVDLISGKYFETQLMHKPLDTWALAVQSKDEILEEGATDDFDFGLNAALIFSRNTIAAAANLNDNRVHISHPLVTIGDVSR